ncbi:MAG: hypothetical protein WCC22_00645 [Terriglobales bacterium]
MALTDTSPTLVYSPSGYWGPAVYSADGKKLLLSMYDGTCYNISSVNLDGTGLVALTSSTDEDDFSPVPYQSVILFNRFNRSGAGAWDIYVMDQTGGNQTLVHSTADTYEALIETYYSGD